MKIKLEQHAIAPTRAHDTDAGLDLYAMESGYIRAHSKRVFHTGVHVELPENTCGLLVSKSGLNVHQSITTTGLIDQSYTGEIKVAMYNHGDSEYYVKKGDKISQLVVMPCMFVPVEIVDQLQDGDRGDSGFGSTGR